MDTNTDKQVKYWDTSAASRAQQKFERTGKTRSPWISHPERETYSEFVVYERQDGSTYTMTREVSCWGGQCNLGDWLAR